ncbi:hypothetical protein EYC84_004456 [Monilinia fructicola]|uniref:Uncharacterized protein n=1 Tax=Monilinia fructicola TaxID=38448 RepID=A0A5M9K5H1_MONFR|nr:hypothetical protein EYC84_004456 [Monilinia fructicola]
MKFTSTLALSTLIASSLAAPAPAPAPASLTPTRSARSLARRGTKQGNDSYNTYWAGGVLDNLGKDEYKTVYGEFTVPVPKKGTAGETSAKVFTVSSWIGIDGWGQSETCQGLWQAGVDSTIDQNGKVTYGAWYEWYPADTLGFSNMPVTAGDLIAITLSYSAYTQGTVKIENKSTGKSETKTVESSSVLCGEAAEWIVEDLSVDDGNTGLASFGNVTFSNAFATTKEGKKVGPSGAILMDVETTKNEVLTQSKLSADSVFVAYNS